MVHRAPNTLTIRGGKDHARRRRIMAQGVSEKAQRGYEGRVLSHIQQFATAAFQEAELNAVTEARGWTAPMDMAKWSNYLSFDIMADVVFGAQYNLVGNSRFRYVVESIDKSNVRMGALIQAPALTSFKLDKYLFRDAIRARNRFVKFVMRVVKERLDKGGAAAAKSADPVSDHDLFANLAAARDPETGSGFHSDEIAAESATLIVAGSDTSSTAMAAVLFYLAHNTDAYERAAAEVRAAFASAEEIGMGARLASCKYLHACIDEALRMSPPVGSALWREVVPPQGAVVDGQAVPAGVDVGVSIYSLHHSAAAFADPFTYRPERWLEDDGTNSVERGRAAYAPFSIGTRGCLGKGLAQTELMLTFATLLFTGDFRLAEGEMGRVGCGKAGSEMGRHRENEFQLSDHVTSQKKGPFLCFSPREVAA
jgi:cytochrome P450